MTGSPRMAELRQRAGRLAVDDYLVTAGALVVVGIVASFGPLRDNKAISLVAVFSLGMAASVLAGSFLDRGRRARKARGSRLELLGRDLIERPAHMLYPDFVVDPGTKSSYTRNIKVRLPTELAFSSMNLVFSRHVAKEDMDAVRMMNLFFHALDVTARDVVIRRDSAFLQDHLRELGVAPSAAIIVEDAQRALRGLNHSVVAIGLGSNLVSRVYATMPEALIELSRDLEATEGRFEPVEIAAPPNSRVTTDLVLQEAMRSDESISADDFLQRIIQGWSDDVVPLSPPSRVAWSSPPRGYRFQSDESTLNHFGFVVRKALNPTLGRHLLIIGGSGPLGTRSAAQFVLDSWDQLTSDLRSVSLASDFVAVVQARELPTDQTSAVDLIHPKEIGVPRLVYMLVRLP